MSLGYQLVIRQGIFFMGNEMITNTKETEDEDYRGDTAKLKAETLFGLICPF